MARSDKTTSHVAECLGVKVPDSPMLTPTRIERINAARYEGQEIAGALRVVREGDRVLELGAGIGIVGAVVAKTAKPSKVMSFEANPALIQHIEALYELNGLHGRISVRNEVLISAPDAPPSLPFHIRNSYLGSSLIDSDSRATTRVDVPTASYGEVHKDFAPDVLLMDIEGGELDFLRHASLDGIRAIVIEFHPDAYGRKGMKECKDILERAGFAKVPDFSTRQVWTCTYDPALRPPAPEGGWSTRISTVQDAIVVPPTESNMVQEAGVLNSDGTWHAEASLWRNRRLLTTSPPMPDAPFETRKGTWLWGGVLWMHFGHFLVESMSRLWALEHLNDKIDGILFIPKRPRNGDEVAGFQRQLLEALGTSAPIACAPAPERIERLIVPGQGFGLGNMVTGTDIFRAAMLKRFGKDINPEGPKQLYISRSLLPSGRGNLIGETEIEDHLSREGYTIYHPQRHDVPHQIATYKAARQIIAAEGSALHLLAMVAHQDAQVAMLVRRPSGATRNIERHLEAFTGQRPVSITRLKRSWKPLGTARPRTWMGELDMPAVQSDLVAAGFISPTGAPWTALDAAEVKERLGDRFEEVA